MFKKIILSVFCFILVLNIANAGYLADIIIEVHENGLVEIKGDSNHPLLKQGVYNNFTSKQKAYWTLNISTQEKFDEYNYELNLPKNSQINYLGVYGVDKFEDKDGLKISGKIKNKPFAIIVQYKYNLVKSNFLIFFLIVSFVLLSLLVVYLIQKIEKNKKKYSKENFSEREYMIIRLLQKNNNCMTQAEIEKKTKLPKASLFRNIESLSRKKIIEKNKTGMTNKIKLI